MRSQAKSSGIKLLEVHGMGRNLDPNLKPEKQHTIPKQGSKERLHTGQGRAGSRGKRPDPISKSINQPSNLSQKIPGRTEIEKRKTNHVHTRDLMHSINNISGKMTNNNPLIQMFPSIQVQFTDPNPNLSSKIHYILRVYRVQLI